MQDVKKQMEQINALIEKFETMVDDHPEKAIYQVSLAKLKMERERLKTKTVMRPQCEQFITGM